MHLVVFLILLFIAGLVVGALARLIVPGPTDMGLLGTSLAGIVGSWLAGLLGYYVITPHSALVAFILAVLCAAVLVFIFGRPRRRAVY
jgi:uncharacterized membrane protein YeaQ/YmgE (transglycosylase-associated protein family)